jgi:5-hydroxyisourate hydrolase
MPAKLTTHVLNLVAGTPAAGMRVELWRRDGTPHRIKMVTTDRDGRTDSPLLGADELVPGRYELVFQVKNYFSDLGVDCTFLEDVPIRFSITDPTASYHVPLLVTPWGYSTYRGS